MSGIRVSDSRSKTIVYIVGSCVGSENVSRLMFVLDRN
jgi:hypothetical protein